MGKEMIVEGCNIMVANQEKLLKYVEHCRISFEMVQYLVLDEADRMLDTGFIFCVKKTLNKTTPACRLRITDSL